MSDPALSGNPFHKVLSNLISGNHPEVPPTTSTFGYFLRTRFDSHIKDIVHEKWSQRSQSATYGRLQQSPSRIFIERTARELFNDLTESEVSGIANEADKERVSQEREYMETLEELYQPESDDERKRYINQLGTLLQPMLSAIEVMTGLRLTTWAGGSFDGNLGVVNYTSKLGDVNDGVGYISPTGVPLLLPAFESVRFKELTLKWMTLRNSAFVDQISTAASISGVSTGIVPTGNDTLGHAPELSRMIATPNSEPLMATDLAETNILAHNNLNEDLNEALTIIPPAFHPPRTGTHRTFSNSGGTFTSPDGSLTVENSMGPVAQLVQIVPQKRKASTSPLPYQLKLARTSTTVPVVRGSPIIQLGTPSRAASFDALGGNAKSYRQAQQAPKMRSRSVDIRSRLRSATQQSELGSHRLSGSPPSTPIGRKDRKTPPSGNTPGTYVNGASPVSSVPIQPKTPWRVASVPPITTLDSTPATFSAGLPDSFAIKRTSRPQDVKRLLESLPESAKWLFQVLMKFTRWDLGNKFCELLYQLVKYESLQGFETSKRRSFSMDSRPPQVKKWIKNNRAIFPEIDNASEYADLWWTWWRSLQPKWREYQNDNRSGSRSRYGTTWDPLTSAPGINGFLSVVASLFWWGSKVRDSRVGEADWENAVEDVAWIFTGLIRYAEEQVTEGPGNAENQLPDLFTP